MQLATPHEQSGQIRVLLGCVISSISIEVNVEEKVTVTVEGLYADEDLDDTAIPSQPTPDTGKAMTFAEGQIQVSGTTERYVQSMSLSIETNTDLIREMGSRTPIDFNPKVLSPTVDFTKLFDGDHTSLEEMFGGSGSTSPSENVENQVALNMIFDNGKAAGSGQNIIDLEIVGTLVESYDENGIGDPTADLEESINRPGTDVNVTATNEVSSAP